MTNINKCFRRAILFITIIFVLVNITGCGKTDKDGLSQNGLSQKSGDIENNESIERTEHLTQEEIKRAKDVTAKNVEEYLLNKVNETIKNYNDLTLKKVDVTEDKLLLEQKSYKKTIKNLVVDILIDIEEDMPHNKKRELTNKFHEDLLDNISPVGDINIELIRLKIVNIMYDNNNILNHSTEFIQMNEDIKDLELTQDENLKKMDKIIFDLINSNMKQLNVKDKEETEYKIERIGIKNSQLLLNTRIFFINFEESEYENKIKNINKDIIKTIKKEEEIMKILTDKNVTNVKIIYDNNWYKNGEQLIFKYDI